MEKSVCPVIWLERRDRLLHSAASGWTAGAIDTYGDASAPRLQDDVASARIRCQDDCRPQHWMPGERHFTRRREDPYPRVCALRRGVGKHGLRVAYLLRQRLQERFRNASRVLEDRQ